MSDINLTTEELNEKLEIIAAEFEKLERENIFLKHRLENANREIERLKGLL